jgi:Spy/CpxP family protein refolding chaperone
MTRIFMPVIVAAFTCLCLPGIAFAQSHNPQQPYAGFETRKIKALSDEQIADLRAGRGLSLALAAELNGYPGPLHTLQFADVLGLSDAQRQRTKELLEAENAETIPIGEKLIKQETELDRLFASKSVEPATLEAATSAIGATQGALRAAHLRYHLTMMKVLTPEQVQRYNELRGYSRGEGQGPDRHGAATRF